MIKMISGVYGKPVTVNGTTTVKAVSPKDGPFSLSPEQEKRLVSRGVAVFVQEPDEFDGGDKVPELPELPEGVIAIPEYNADMKADELREIGKLCGLTFKVGMTKLEMVAALDEYIEANMVEDDELTDLDDEAEDEGEDAPEFDPAGAVQ